MQSKASTTNTGISVRNLKPIVDLVRGEKVDKALQILQFLHSPAANHVAKVIKAAVSNAENELLTRETGLHVSEIYADEGPRLKRFRARARGRANRIIKRNSHITVVVSGEEV